MHIRWCLGGDQSGRPYQFWAAATVAPPIYFGTKLHNNDWAQVELNKDFDVSPLGVCMCVFRGV